MLAGSLCKENKMINEFHAFMEGFKEAYGRKYKKITLETDHVDIYGLGAIFGGRCTPQHADIQ